MMTKKNYIAAAKLVNDMVSHAKDPSRITGSIVKRCELDSATEVANAFIKLFEEDNPRFDKKKFLVACNLEDK